MGFWQHLANGYELNKDFLSKKYPLSSTPLGNKRRKIIVYIGDDGVFKRAEEIKKQDDNKSNPDKDIIFIPTSQESAGRSSNASKYPHPIFDKYQYFSERKRFEIYFKNLEEFKNSKISFPELEILYRYLEKNTLISDLQEQVDNKKLSKIKNEDYILFAIEKMGEVPCNLWKYPVLFEKWHEYDLLKKGISDVDYITGEKTTAASVCPKNISFSFVEAKLISDNDDSNFTYRGKFENAKAEAYSVGYESSQKAHQFLRYLIQKQGIFCDNQVIVSYSMNLKKEKQIRPPIFYNEEDDEEANDLEDNTTSNTGINYFKSVRKALHGLALDNSWRKHPATVIFILEAFTTGRASITFYREMLNDEYLNKIQKWHDNCKWNLLFKTKDKKSESWKQSAPSIDDIIETAYVGNTNDKNYHKFQKKAREVFLKVIFDDSVIPLGYLNMAYYRVANPLSITDKKGKFNRFKFKQYLARTCAIWKKHYLDTNNKEISMKINLEETNREYLFGRLLGAADKLEEYALWKKDNKRIVTSAIRYMQAFSQRPFSTWKTIHEQLTPYIQETKKSIAFSEIEKITNLFEQKDYDSDKPLNAMFLFGYYHERAYIDELANELNKKTSEQSNENE